jgi:asparagine synthase (glutamine-hydrolysing)
VRDRFAAMAAREPVRRQRWVRWIWRMRSLQLTLRGMEALAADQGTLLVSPFLAPEFLAAYAAWTADSPPQTRTEAVREVAAGLMPDAVLERRTKATFDGAFWGRHSRGFAASLDAAEIDSDLVDGERALAFWAAGGTDTAGPIPSSTLLQALWLERESRSRVERREERAAGSVACDPVAAATQL